MSATKKKVAVNPAQFEDADEEAEELANEKPDGGSDAEEATASPKKGTAPDAKKPEPERKSPSADTPSSDEEKEATSSPKEEDSPTNERPASTSPTHGKGSDSPLDALASACLAEKQQLAKPTKLPTPKAPKEGTKIPTEEISCTDVLCGRGGQSNHHPGNIFFRRLVRAKQEEYLKANKREKTVVAKDIVKLIRMLSPPGRFLKKDPKDESVYIDVGDVQARNKASQALREGAPELREELRDQHNRLGVGGGEVKLPYHGQKGSAASSEDRGERGMSRKEREAMAARAAAAQGLMMPAFAGAEGMAGRTGLRGQADPPDGEDDEAETPNPAVSAAAMQAAAEERARRLMLAGGHHPGLGAAHMLNPHLGLGGLGGPHMNPFLAGHSPAAAAQLAALHAGGSHLLSPQALMMAAAHQPSAAALLQAQRARELAHFEAANYAAATGVNPLFLGAHGRGAAGAAQFQEQMRLHELMSAAGNGNNNPDSKREREEMEGGENEESRSPKMSRQMR